MTQYPAMSFDVKQGVAALLMTDDESRRMPKGGPKLDASEVQLWLLVSADGGQAALTQQSAPKMQPVP